MNTIFLDLETLKPALPANPDVRFPDIQYALTWQEEAARGFAGMGLACLIFAIKEIVFTVYKFDEENNPDVEYFRDLLAIADRIVTFGGSTFDLVILKTNGFITKAESYDLREKIREALNIELGIHTGITLNGLAKANSFQPKSNDAGYMAPVLWQRGEQARVIEACAEDVRIVKQLYLNIQNSGGLWLPITKVIKTRKWVSLDL